MAEQTRVKAVTGLSAQPCGVLVFRTSVEDVQLLIRTTRGLMERKSLIQCRGDVDMWVMKLQSQLITVLKTEMKSTNSTLT